MPADISARKSFEAGARTARETVDRGTAAVEQATRQAEQSYSFAADGIHEFNAKPLDIAQANTTAGMNFLSELAHAKGPTEAMELWSRHAQNHLQRLTNSCWNWQRSVRELPLRASNHLPAASIKRSDEHVRPEASGRPPTFRQGPLRAA
jgi:hypothetical protein